MEYKQKPRFGTSSPFGSVTFELEKTVQIVQRRYPTFVDMIAKFGGLARVITFFIFSFVSLHHLVVMERYILNEAILQRRKEERSRELRAREGRQLSLEPHAEETPAFSYLEVARFKFLFLCVRKSPRFRQYEESVKVITQRMDAQSIVTNGGNVSLLSSTLLKPYQMALVQELHKTSLSMDLSTKVVSLREALDELKAGNNSSLPDSDLLSAKIDSYINKAIQEKLTKASFSNQSEVNENTRGRNQVNS